MFQRQVLLIAASAMFFSACNQRAADPASDNDAWAVSANDAGTPVQTARANPLLSKSELPFQAPPFDEIQDSDFEPAIDEGMKQQIVEIDRIADNPEPPGFENTFVAMEQSGALLNRAMAAFGTLSGANTNPTLQTIEENMAPKLAAHQDAIYLNDRLFERIVAVHDQLASLQLDAESARLVDVVYRDFVHHGAQLAAADKARLKELNKEESTLSTQFTNRLLAATRAAAPVFDDDDNLLGLTDGEKDAAAAAAKSRQQDSRWLLALQNTTQQPALQDLQDRDTRKALFEVSWNRAEQGDANDTRQIISRIAMIRAEYASLLGFDNYAAWKLVDQMARTPPAAITFMQKLMPPATARARAEAADIQALIDKQGGGFKAAAWDWKFYAEQVRKSRYDLDENAIKPYFELDNVLENGVFYAATRLYGITFRERKDIPVYQEDMRVFEVLDEDGSSLALFYADYFKRDNKNGGAWMNNLVSQSGLLGTKPVIYNVANFTKPAPGQPALLSFDNVTTMFHEFGHALHGIFADAQYPTLSGTNTARDFVEFPSQLNEHWATDPAVFANYAKHYQTGEAMPAALVDKIMTSRLAGKGYDMTELVGAALLDMEWHMLDVKAPLQDAGEFESAAMKRSGIDPGFVPPRYRSSYFQHIWGNGYAAGYYAYLWTEMLADDAFQWFTDNGGLTRANGDRFRKMVLSRGNSEDLATMYRNWRGADPAIEPMLRDRGLQGTLH